MLITIVVTFQLTVVQDESSLMIASIFPLSFLLMILVFIVPQCALHLGVGSLLLSL